MADLVIVADYELFDNYVSLVIGLSVTVNGLQDYVHNTLNILHHGISNLNFGKCSINCSRKFGNKFINWCHSCTAWKQELEKEKRIQTQPSYWNRMDSIDWSQSYEEIGKVYVKELHTIPFSTFRDLGAILSLFKNCKRFRVDRQVLEDTLKTRNDYFAHNYELIIHNVDKTRCFDSLIGILQENDITITSSAKDALQKLRKLMITRGVTKEIVGIASDIQNTLDVQIVAKNNDNNNENRKLNELRLVTSRIELWKPKPHQNYKQRKRYCSASFLKSSITLLYYATLIVSCLYGVYTPEKEPQLKTSDSNMADLVNVADYELFDNYVSLVIGLSVTVNGLQDYVHNILNILHHGISNLNFGKCSINCSRKFGNKFINWCHSCTAWKHELEKEKRIQTQPSYWNRMDSIDWSQSYEEIGKVYVKDLHTIPFSTFRDLGAILSLLKNCKRFRVDRQVLEDTLKTRNDYFAHNYELMVHNVDKTRCFDSLIRILQEDDITITSSAKDALQKLRKLMITRGVTKEIVGIAGDIQNTLDVQIVAKNNDNNNENRKLNELRLVTSRIELWKPKPHQNYKQRKRYCSATFLKSSITLLYYVTLLVPCLYGVYTPEKEPQLKTSSILFIYGLLYCNVFGLELTQSIYTD